MNEPLICINLRNNNSYIFKTYNKQPIATETPITLTVDEENVLRYACKYVTRKLYQNFLKQL